MAIWSAEIKELEKLYESLKGQLPDIEKELERLIRADDENMILLYSRRCLEVIITDLCECELNRPRKTEPLKGIIDKLHKEEKVPSHIITSMHGLNDLSTYGAHPKDFDPEQVKPVLVNLDIIIKWYLKYKRFPIVSKTESEEEKSEIKHQKYPSAEKSIIVLPFENISSDPEQEYFSDGLTEEIITDLSYIKELLVISRSSAMTFKGAKATIKEITDKVHVRYVLEGSVRKAGNNIRITAQLIDGLTDTHIWAEKYQGTLDDIFNIQEKVSHSIADSLKLNLTSGESQNINSRPIENTTAYDCYLRARQGFWMWDREALKRSEQQLKNGLNITGENELIYAGLGFVSFQLFNYGLVPEYSLLEKTRDYANKIFKINAGSPLGIRLNGLVTLFTESLQKASIYFNKILYFNPNDSEALLFYSMCLIYSGKNEEARATIEKVLKIDPLTWLNHLALSLLFIMEGDYSRTLKQTEKTYLMEPANPYIKFMYAYSLAYEKSYNKSFDILDEVAIEGKDFYLGSMSNFVKYAFQNEKEKALMAVSPELKKKSENDWEIAWQMAECYAMINEKQLALDCIEYSIKRGMINYPFLAEKNAYLNNIRGEERFKKLMERVKYEWENFEV